MVTLWRGDPGTLIPIFTRFCQAKHARALCLEFYLRNDVQRCSSWLTSKQAHTNFQGFIWAPSLTVETNGAGLISLIRELSGNLLRREINQVGIWLKTVCWVGYLITVTQLQIPLSIFCPRCWGWVFLVARWGLTLCDPMDRRPPGSSLHRASPGKNTGVGCHALLQGIFLTQDCTGFSCVWGWISAEHFSFEGWHLFRFCHEGALAGSRKAGGGEKGLSVCWWFWSLSSQPQPFAPVGAVGSSLQLLWGLPALASSCDISRSQACLSWKSDRSSRKHLLLSLFVPSALGVVASNCS